jgi:hypothetical protein
MHRLTNLALALVAVTISVLAVEFAFRTVPSLLPTGSYSFGRPHPDLRMSVHGGPALYNKVRRVRREPNREGFLDVEHAIAKPAGTTRVGFFGDSYVKSVQVPLEEVFVRRIPYLIDQPVETLGFGISGWGTLHAMLAYDVFSERYDVDVAVYVFVENDLGDQLHEIAGRKRQLRSAMPYGRIRDDRAGYEITWEEGAGSDSTLYRLLKLAQEHLLLAHVVRNRLELLLQEGVRTRGAEEAVELTTVAGAIPQPMDLPSTWPARYARSARLLGERILADWNGRARARGDDFTVFYVPRGEAQLAGAVGLEDTWLPWLRETCARLAIPLIDPTSELRERMNQGDPVYDDHWTPAGHEVVSEVLARHLTELLRLRAPRAAPERS